MQDKTDITSQAVAHTGGAVSTLSGLWGWLGSNHDQIAALGVLFGIILGCGGAVVNFIHKRRVERILKQQGIVSLTRHYQDK